MELQAISVILVNQSQRKTLTNCVIKHFLTAF